MNKVLPFPAATTMTPQQALDSAKALEPMDVLVIGYDQNGELLVRSSRMDRKDALWLVEAAKRYVTGDLEC